MSALPLLSGDKQTSGEQDINDAYDPNRTSPLSTQSRFCGLLDQSRLNFEAAMSGLEFTEDAARRLESLYLTRDVVAQRAETIRRLALSRGERVLDIGCGPGFLCESIAAAVGDDGAVTGIDISGDLIELCKRRNPPQWLSFMVGDATKLAQSDASVDVVVCTQVAEYVSDVSRVLSEAFRVLRLGGRAVFVATDWDALIWHSESPDRMASVLRSWEAHCAHPHLPRSLAPRLVSAGFRFDELAVFPILNLQWDDQFYSKGLAGLIREFVARKNEAPTEELRGWYDEFSRLGDAGRYFFSSNRYIFLASKPRR
jgi:arsenite methyltransferase